jgi:ribosomal protein S18 acetylase RimI-like enzyme
MSPVRYRQATSNDVAAIAALHADSWRRNYRGAYLDSYLDGDVVTERVATWTERLSTGAGHRVTLVAELDGALAGFAHTMFDEDPRWGSLLDNLHVSHALKGQRIGSHLMAETASAVLRERPGTGLYLWVLEQNEAAQAFYEARRGQRADRRLAGPFPGGGRAYTIRYAWPDPSILIPDRQ